LTGEAAKSDRDGRFPEDFTMRVTSFAPLLSLLFLCACGGEEPAPVAPAPPPPVTAAPPPTASATAEAPKPSLAEMQKTDLGAALDGLNQHDPAKFASVYANDAVVDVAGLNELNGREAIQKNMAEWFDVFKNAKLGFSRVWTKGDTMVLEWVINATHHGELFGVKGTEQPIGHYGLSVVSFGPDGKVTHENRYGDLGAVMTQIGGSKAKATARPIPEIPKTPDVVNAANTPAEEKNLEIAKSALGALESKKEADFTALLADDVQNDGLFAIETTKGKDGAKKFFKTFTTAFPDAKFETSRALAIGDYAIVESVLKATQKGALGSIPATKKPIAVHLVDVFQIKDGKIAHAWTYQNSLEMQEQLGLFDVKAGSIPPGGAAAAPKPKSGAAPAPVTTPKKGGGTGGGGGNDTGGGGGKGTGGGGGHGGKK
jgi:steroid delta-isomerase-like uncharacterized protein